MKNGPTIIISCLIVATIAIRVFAADGACGTAAANYSGVSPCVATPCTVLFSDMPIWCDTSDTRYYCGDSSVYDHKTQLGH